MTGMDESYFQNCRKAARANLPGYTGPGEWQLAMEWYVRRNKAPHESYEAAWARLLETDAEMIAMDRMRRQARDMAPRTGRPRKYHPTAKQAAITKAEDRLFNLAVKDAITMGDSFEKAYVRVIDTPEGRDLYMQTRGR